MHAIASLRTVASTRPTRHIALGTIASVKRRGAEAISATASSLGAALSPAPSAAIAPSTRGAVRPGSTAWSIVSSSASIARRRSASRVLAHTPQKRSTSAGMCRLSARCRSEAAEDTAQQWRSSESKRYRRGAAFVHAAWPSIEIGSKLSMCAPKSASRIDTPPRAALLRSDRDARERSDRRVDLLEQRRGGGYCLGARAPQLAELAEARPTVAPRSPGVGVQLEECAEQRELQGLPQRQRDAASLCDAHRRNDDAQYFALHLRVVRVAQALAAKRLAHCEQQGFEGLRGRRGGRRGGGGGGGSGGGVRRKILHRHVAERPWAARRSRAADVRRNRMRCLPRAAFEDGCEGDERRGAAPAGVASERVWKQPRYDRVNLHVRRHRVRRGVARADDARLLID